MAWLYVLLCPNLSLVHLSPIKHARVDLQIRVPDVLRRWVKCVGEWEEAVRCGAAAACDDGSLRGWGG